MGLALPSNPTFGRASVSSSRDNRLQMASSPRAFMRPMASAMASVRLMAPVLITVMVLGWSGSARAWAEARVQAVTARVQLLPEGPARVAIDMKLKVLGGWLSRFDIEGLDSDMALDADAPPLLLSADGVEYLPTATVRGAGSLSLSFASRRRAPRRGVYSVALAYFTDFRTRPHEALPGDRARFRWTLPGWQVGLGDVSIEITGPRGTRPAAVPDDQAYTLQTSHFDQSQHSVVQWRRVHLARTVAWTVAFDVPKRYVAPKSGAQATHGAQATEGVIGGIARATTPPNAGGQGALWLSAILALLALLKRRAVQSACRRLRIEPVPLVRVGPDAVRALLLIGSAAAAGLVFHSHRSLALLLLCAVVALGIDRAHRRGHGHGRQSGPWDAVAEGDLKAGLLFRLTTWFNAGAWFDITTPLGCALLISACTVAGLLLWLGIRPQAELWALGTMLATPLLVTGTRKHLPPPPEMLAPRLRRLVAEFESKATATVKAQLYLDLIGCRTHARAWRELRLRLRPNGVAQGLACGLARGLEHLDLLFDKGQNRHPGRPKLTVLAVASADSEADRVLRATMPDVEVWHSDCGQRVVRMGSSADPVAWLCAITDGLTQMEAPLQQLAPEPAVREAAG